MITIMSKEEVPIFLYTIRVETMKILGLKSIPSDQTNPIFPLNFDYYFAVWLDVGLESMSSFSAIALHAAAKYAK